MMHRRLQQKRLHLSLIEKQSHAQVLWFQRLQGSGQKGLTKLYLLKAKTS